MTSCILFKLLSTTKVILDKPVWLPQETYIRMTNKWGNSGRSYVCIRCVLRSTHETNSTALRLPVKMTTFIGSHITSMYAFLVNAQLLQIILIMIIRRWRTIKNESSCRWGAARSLARLLARRALWKHQLPYAGTEGGKRKQAIMCIHDCICMHTHVTRELSVY